MQQIWLQHYPAQIPARINVTPFSSVVDMLDAALQRHAQRPALSSLGQTCTYADLDRMARQFATWLQTQGVTPGDRVALMMPNITPFAVAAIGTLRAGATMVAVNPLYTARELAHQLHDSGAKVLVVFGAFAPTVAEALAQAPDLQQIVQIPGGTASTALPQAVAWADALQVGASATFSPVSLRPQDLAFLQYTGGTTGVSKGAMLTHANIVANVMQIASWLSPALPLEEAPGKNIACFLPLYHIFALTFCLVYGLYSGTHNLLVANPRDLDGAVRELGGHAIHLLPGVNTLFGALAQNPAVLERLDLRELKLAIGGGSAVQQGVAERWLAATGIPICEGYGLSETSPLASCNIITAQQWTGTIGLPVPNTDIAILDDEGREVPCGERGEISIRGPQVMAGYWRRPDETERVMTTDGYFKSGDIGTMDAQGQVRIVDRKKDMILVSGFNVFPNEIENVVSTLPGVLESAAIGVADERSGEAVKLFVVRQDPSLTIEAVQAHCRQNLTGYKNPKHIVFIEALPKSTVGKVLRRALHT